MEIESTNALEFKYQETKRREREQDLKTLRQREVVTALRAKQLAAAKAFEACRRGFLHLRGAFRGRPAAMHEECQSQLRALTAKRSDVDAASVEVKTGETLLTQHQIAGKKLTLQGEVIQDWIAHVHRRHEHKKERIAFEDAIEQTVVRRCTELESDSDIEKESSSCTTTRYGFAVPEPENTLVIPPSYSAGEQNSAGARYSISSAGGEDEGGGTQAGQSRATIDTALYDRIYDVCASKGLDGASVSFSFELPGRSSYAVRVAAKKGSGVEIEIAVRGPNSAFAIAGQRAQLIRALEQRGVVVGAVHMKRERSKHISVTSGAKDVTQR